MDKFPSPPALNELLQHELTQPVVFKNRLKGNKWDCIPWTQKQLLDRYGNLSLSYRVVQKNYKDIAWESSSKHIEATLEQFLEWLTGPVQDSPFEQFSPEEFWAYSSYNHMVQTFNELDDIVQAIDWSPFGYYEKAGQNSAFWIGSTGSYTPCHYDTYGYNLVAQIQGSKRWILFPPDDSAYMYPTRIPYEESSVYSSVNILKPDFIEHPLFKFTHPHVVVLEPGDVLFVPHKWWHFVQSLNLSFSVNTWIKMDIDNDSHLEEAVARVVMSGLISYFEPEETSWVNTHEELVSPEETLEYVTLSLSKSKRTGSHDETELQHPSKSIKSNSKCDVHSSTSNVKSISTLQHPDIKFATAIPFSEWFSDELKSFPTSKHIPSEKEIINCFTHPEVISVICKLLKKS